MKLKPRQWTWEGTPGKNWLTPSPEAEPVVWQARLSDDPSDEAQLGLLLSTEERARLERFRIPADQRRFLLGRGLLRILIGLQLNIPAERVEFSYGQFGKPFLPPRAGQPGLQFNVAHSGQLVLLAFHATKEVGVDVEEVRSNPDCEAIARRVFSAGEYNEWAALKPADRLLGFFQTWTRHEAGLKATGHGLAREGHLSSQTVLMYFHLELPAGYQGCVGILR